MIRFLPLLAVIVVALEQSAFAAGRPNFLIILADDVGRDAIGCYGGRSYATPSVDALAAEGLRFEQAYVMPVCHPTRTTLLSGRYPFRQGHVRWGSYPRDEEKTTVAALLQKAGYATAIAGKWQLGLLKDDPQQPRRMGFAKSCLFGWHEGPRYWGPLLYENGKARRYTDDTFGPDLYVQFLTRFMEQHREGPFLAFYSMALSHAVTDDLAQPVPFGPGKDRYESFTELMDAMDERVGRIVQAVDNLGLAKQTMVLFLGDNGTTAKSIVRAEDGKYIQEPVLSETTWGTVPGGKGTLTDAGTRVPWIVRWPGTVPAGRVTDALVDGSDLLPTLLELAGVPLPPNIKLDGRSFAVTLSDPKRGHREWVYAEYRGNSFVADKRWKLMSDGELFDRTADPLETIPVRGDSSEVSAARKRLRQIAEQLQPPR